MNDKGRAGNRCEQRLLIHEVSLDKLKLIVELLAESLLKRLKLGGIVFVTNGTANSVATVLKVQKSNVGAKVARDACDCHNWFSFSHTVL